MSFFSVFRVWPILLITLLFVTACSDDGTTPQQNNHLTGQVLDADGAPLADAGILMDFALPGKKRPTTGFSFELAEASAVKCWIMNDCSADTVRVLVDEVLDPGSYSFLWDGKDTEGLIVPGGRYDWYIQTEDELTSGPSMLIHGGYPADANPDDYLFQATTGPDGSFTLEQACLPFGDTFAMVDEMGDTTSTWTVSREVRFFAMHEDFETAASGWVIAHENSGCDVTIEFEDLK
jgi:hypothetical protein